MLDLIIAGGGPAGLVTALQARAAGLDVAVLEPRTGPVDKACGEGLMPGAVAALRRLGVDVGGRPFVGISYHGYGASADADFRRGPGAGVRRLELSRRLRDAAAAGGVDLVERMARDLRQRDRSVEVSGLRARHLVARTGCTPPSGARSAWRRGLRAHAGTASGRILRAPRGASAWRCTGRPMARRT